MPIPGLGGGYDPFILSRTISLVHKLQCTEPPMYPVQAPLSVTQNAPALAFMWFLSSFAGEDRPIP
ncbi:hypothetical protein L210DRAFT_3575920 [Boletus edulis BED1]|uniref:Uncharacterized protein n=1 Tax=Boletus edulis BED1 TaxID=1328754 RepID=A0AAD4BDE0_BOLED|nr:hypothetical protein L210DRAFT_3575920 [Boletus edulis BED1]